MKVLINVDSDETIEILISMGFTREQAIEHFKETIRNTFNVIEIFEDGAQ